MAAVMLVVPLALFLTYGGVSNTWASGEMRDFAIIHDSARAAITGANPYIPTSEGLDNLNPPHVVLLTLPLGLLSIRTAALVMWSLIGLSVVVLTAKLARRVVPLGTAITATVVALAAGPIIDSVRLINFGWPLALGVSVAWIWMREGLQTRAGVLIGFLAAPKLFLFILLAHLAWRKQWRALAWAAGSSVVTLSIGVAWVGLDATQTWLAGQSAHVSQSDLAMNLSLFGALKRGFAPTPELSGFRALADLPSIVTPAWVVLSLALGGLFWWRYRHSPDLDAEWASILLAALLISPLGWGYYLSMAIGPLTAVFARQGMTPAVWLGIVGIVLSWPATIGQPSALATVTVGSAATWSVLFLVGLLTRPGFPAALGTRPDYVRLTDERKPHHSPA